MYRACERSPAFSRDQTQVVRLGGNRFIQWLISPALFSELYPELVFMNILFFSKIVLPQMVKPNVLITILVILSSDLLVTVVVWIVNVL